MNTSYPEHSIHPRYASLILFISALFTLLMLGAIYFFSKDNLLLGMAVLFAPVPFICIYYLFKFPKATLIVAFYCNYFALGLSRYLPAPMGLTVDGVLFLTLIALIFSQFNQKVPWHMAARDYTFIVVAWFIMIFMQLFNPEAVSREAWFYAMRGYALYIVFTVPLVYILFNKPQDLEFYIKMLAWFTIAAVLKGVGQKFLGVDPGEKKWLMLPGNKSTHLLFGQLRVFSFFSDAGTYGSSMGYAGAVYTIIAIHTKVLKSKLFYLTVGVMGFYAMLISGTRSSIAVPLSAFAVYAVLTKNFKVMGVGAFFLFSIFFFLKYTTIGQGNYDIRRMRTAFADDNASMNTRLENRKIFAEYLKTRPFGGGVGSAGNWGMRFSPGTLLADTATDGWYVQIWAETGIVGLVSYCLMVAYMLFKSCIIIFFRLKKPEYLYPAIAFTSGIFGLMVSSYTASSMGQMPNTVIAFTTLTLISLMPEWEEQEKQKKIQ